MGWLPFIGTYPYYPSSIESFKVCMESFGGPVDTFRYVVMILPNVNLQGDMDLPFVYLGWHYLHNVNQWEWFFRSPFDVMIRVCVDYPNAVSEKERKTVFKNYLSINPSITKGRFKCYFSTLRDERIEIILYSMDGRKTKTLFSNFVKKGLHYFYPDISNLPQGVYFIQAKGVDFTRTRKIIIIK